MSTSRSPLVAIPVLAASWCAFGEVLSFKGLVLWVIGGCLAAYLVVDALVRGRRRLVAAITVVVMTGLIALLARQFGGSDAGPVTRSALMAAAVGGAAALVAHTRYPLAVVPASLVLLAGALGLGAADHVLWIVGMWAVIAAATAAILGPYARSDLVDRRRLLPFAAILGLVGVAAVVIATAVAPWPRTAWIFDAETPLSVPSTDEPPAPPPATDSSATAGLAPFLQRLLLGLLVIALVVLFVLLARRLGAALAWRRRQQVLQRGTAADRVLGAWTWIRLRRARFDQPLPTHASPDVAVLMARQRADADLETTAELAARVAYDPHARVDESDATRAWAAARRAGSAPVGSTARQRWQWSGRFPGAADALLTRGPRGHARPRSAAGT